jgi:nucleoid DNA-binding protein
LRRGHSRGRRRRGGFSAALYDMPPKAKPKAKKAKVESMTKAQAVSELATQTGLTKAQIGEVFGALSTLIAAELKAGHAFTIPGLVKVTLQRKEATPERPGISPFTKLPIIISAKPARKVVKVRAVKALKDMA